MAAEPPSDRRFRRLSGLPFASLRIPRFRRLWFAITIFNTVHLVQVVASSWLILDLTGSPLWVSAMVAAPTLPILFASLPAGAAADLIDRRVLLILASVVMATASFGMSILTMTGTVTPIRLVGLGLFLGVGIAIFNPAWQATVPALVPQHLLSDAIALNSASGGVAGAVGPALGGALVATVGPGWSFTMAAAGYVTILAIVVAARGLAWESERDSMGVAIATGLRYLRFTDGYFGLLALGCTFGFFSAALRAMLPNLTSDVFEGAAAVYGLLLGGFGAGAVLGGITRAAGSRLLAGRMMAGSIVGFGCAGLLVGLTSDVGIALAGVVAAGWLWTWILATMNSTFQVLTPDWVRGRTMGAFILSIHGSLSLGAVASGRLGEWIGPSMSVSAFSVVLVVVGTLALSTRLPVLENIRAPVVPRARQEEVDRSDGTGPVKVVSSWTFAGQSTAQLASTLAALRRVRLSTGAFQWSVFRSLPAPARIVEVYTVHSWNHHIQQMGRLDLEDLEVLEQVGQISVSSSLSVEYLVEIDIEQLE